MKSGSISDAEADKAIKEIEALTSFLEEFTNGEAGEAGNYTALLEAYRKLMQLFIELGDSSLIKRTYEKKIAGKYDWTLDDYLEWFGSNFKAGGGLIKPRHIKPIFRAGGGLGVDSVPAYLQPGEFVQRASAVNTAGLGVMNALNNGDLSTAYRLIGSKINGHWNNSRTTNSATDNRRSVYAPSFVTVRGRASSVANYNSWANRLALGY